MNAHRYAPAELKGNREIVLKAVAEGRLALEHAPAELRGDREIMLEAVAQNGSALKHASEELRGDREIVLEAVAQNGLALEHASEELRGDREIVLEAVAEDGWALRYASPKLRDDREIVLKAVAQSGRALKHASEEQRGDREIVLKAVVQNGRALERASPELRGDRAFMQEAVAQNGLALEYASPKLTGDREIVLKAVAQNGRALEFASEELRGDRAFLLDAMHANGAAFAATDRQDLELARAAIDNLLCAQDNARAEAAQKRACERHEFEGLMARKRQCFERSTIRVMSKRRRAILVLCARQPDDDDLEGLGEIKEINNALAQHRQYNRNADVEYELHICTTMDEVREYVDGISAPIDLDNEARQPSLPIAVVHVITHAKATTGSFYLDEDVKWEVLAKLFGASKVCPEGVHYWLACCNGWQRKGSQLVDYGKNPTLPQSLLAWTTLSENEENISVTRVYYEELFKASTSDLAARVHASVLKEYSRRLKAWERDSHTNNN